MIFLFVFKSPDPNCTSSSGDQLLQQYVFEQEWLEMKRKQHCLPVKILEI